MIIGAGITQLVECKLPKLDAAGSSPVARSIKPLFQTTPGFGVPILYNQQFGKSTGRRNASSHPFNEISPFTIR